MTKQVAPITRQRIEWPTVAVAVALYSSFGLLTWYATVLPWWLVLPAGGYLVAWHGSLQHEAVHGHPTRWAWLNELLVLPSLWLWLPFRIYRETHLRHHVDAWLTDPMEDPESYYVTAEQWQRSGPWARRFLWARNTLAGRLLLEPAACMLRFWRREAQRLLNGDFSRLPAWLLHAAGCALVLVWVLWVCGLPFWTYVALFVYPGLSLTLLRSFLEHQARPEVAARTAIVESGAVFSLLYLNNNLHALHHAEPGVPWYRLRALYRARRDTLLAANGGYRYSGYAEIVARYLLWPKEYAVQTAALTSGDQAALAPPSRVLRTTNASSSSATAASSAGCS